ncbi:hypothetical protein ES703_35151 [subsurface metagenome]
MLTPLPTAVASDEDWVCLSCGKRGDFTLLGRGFIKCSGCGSVHFVEHNGRLQLCQR